MSSIVDSAVSIQTSSRSIPSTPSWLGEVVLISCHLSKLGILDTISERVRFARRRFGHYEVIDFMAVLFGYAISGERTLQGFYEALLPWAETFMALFGRDRLPARSTLSRFLASLTQTAVEALRTLFLEDLLARPLGKERQTGGLLDRAGNQWMVFDVDGTREAARQRAVPKTADLPPPQRRLSELCALGYTGRKRGEIVRTRTTISQTHSFQWLGSFGNSGNGQYREELRRAVSSIGSYLAAHQLPQERALVRLDGQYGTGAVLSDLAGFAFVVRGKDYTVLDRPEVQSRLHLPADQQFTRPASDLVRTLYDCPDVPVGPDGAHCRMVVATHPANAQKSRVGLTRSGVVYELFFTNLPRQAFTAADIIALAPPIAGLLNPPLPMRIRNRTQIAGALMPLATRKPGRLSRNGSGISASNWVITWSRLRCAPPSLLLPLCLQQSPRRTPRATLPPQAALPWKAGRFSGGDFALQADGALRCPAGARLSPTEYRRERDGTLRVLYAARMRDCRPCLMPRTMPVARPPHDKAAPSESAVASAGGGLGSLALA